MNRVLDSLRRFQAAQVAAARRASDALGIPETSLQALRELVHAEAPVTMKDLAVAIGVSPAVATGVIDRLEVEGWVQRRIDPADRRAFRVVLTLDDDSRVLRVIHELDDPLRRVANSISADEARMVRALAEAMQDQLDRFEPEAVLQR